MSQIVKMRLNRSDIAVAATALVLLWCRVLQAEPPQMETAIAEGNPVLLEFSASWCKACPILDALLANEQTSDALSLWHLVRVDADAAAGAAIAKQYHVSVYPTLIAIDFYGNEVSRMEGVRDGAVGFDGLLVFLQDSRLRADSAAAIANALKRDGRKSNLVRAARWYRLHGDLDLSLKYWSILLKMRSGTDAEQRRYQEMVGEVSRIIRLRKEIFDERLKRLTDTPENATLEDFAIVVVGRPMSVGYRTRLISGVLASHVGQALAYARVALASGAIDDVISISKSQLSSSPSIDWSRILAEAYSEAGNVSDAIRAEDDALRLASDEQTKKQIELDKARIRSRAKNDEVEMTKTRVATFWKRIDEIDSLPRSIPRVPATTMGDALSIQAIGKDAKQACTAYAKDITYAYARVRLDKDSGKLIAASVFLPTDGLGGLRACIENAVRSSANAHPISISAYTVPIDFGTSGPP